MPAVLRVFAKQTQTAVFTRCHVTEDGTLLQEVLNMVDCCVIRRSEDSRFRTLRGMKKRFGAVMNLAFCHA